MNLGSRLKEALYLGAIYSIGKMLMMQIFLQTVDVMSDYWKKKMILLMGSNENQ